MKNTYRRIDAVGKAIGILRFLSEQRGPTSGAEISRAVNLPVGTVMCHLMTLEDNGMVQEIGEHWKLGMGLALFWARVKSGKESEMASIQKDLGTLQ